MLHQALLRPTRETYEPFITLTILTRFSQLPLNQVLGKREQSIRTQQLPYIVYSSAPARCRKFKERRIPPCSTAYQSIGVHAAYIILTHIIIAGGTGQTHLDACARVTGLRKLCTCARFCLFVGGCLQRWHFSLSPVRYTTASSHYFGLVYQGVVSKASLHCRYSLV